jgi:hypothetical protein
MIIGNAGKLAGSGGTPTRQNMPFGPSVHSHALQSGLTVAGAPADPGSPPHAHLLRVGADDKVVRAEAMGFPLIQQRDLMIVPSGPSISFVKAITEKELS